MKSDVSLCKFINVYKVFVAVLHTNHIILLPVLLKIKITLSQAQVINSCTCCVIHEMTNIQDVSVLPTKLANYDNNIL